MAPTKKGKGKQKATGPSTPRTKAAILKKKLKKDRNKDREGYLHGLQMHTKHALNPKEDKVSTPRALMRAELTGRIPAQQVYTTRYKNLVKKNDKKLENIRMLEENDRTDTYPNTSHYPEQYDKWVDKFDKLNEVTKDMDKTLMTKYRYPFKKGSYASLHDPKNHPKWIRKHMPELERRYKKQ